MGDKAVEGAPIVKLSQPRTGKNRRPVPLMNVGTDTCKGILFSFLENTEPGPGYCHWPTDEGAGYDLEYFRQLTAEEIRFEMRRGKKIRVWHQTRARNEALDCWVYSLAAMFHLNPIWDSLAERLKPEDEDENSPESTPPPARNRRPGGSFMGGSGALGG